MTHSLPQAPCRGLLCLPTIRSHVPVCLVLAAAAFLASPVLAGDDPDEGDTCSTALELSDSSQAGLRVELLDEDWYRLQVDPGATLTVALGYDASQGDIDVELYDDCGGLLLAAGNDPGDDELVIWTNGGASPIAVRLHVFLNLGAQVPGNDYSLDITGSTGPVGHAYCNVNSNSTGAPARIAGFGTASLGANLLELSAAPVPDTYYIFYSGFQPKNKPFGNGYLCATNHKYRFGRPRIASEHYASAVADLDEARVVPGRLFFQCWFRDPDAGGAFFNTSDGLYIDFVP